MRRFSIRTASAGALLLACVTAYSACGFVDPFGPAPVAMTLSIQGHVTNALDGSPLEGLRVTLYHESEGAVRHSNTQPSGFYWILIAIRARRGEPCTGDPPPTTAPNLSLRVSSANGTTWTQMDQSYVIRCTEDDQTVNFQMCPPGAWNSDSRACVAPATSRSGE